MSEPGANCSSRCETKDHRSFGECVRGVGVLGAASHHEAAWDNELHAYADARKAGINPAGTTKKAVDDAVRISNELGRPYDAEARVVVQP